MSMNISNGIMAVGVTNKLMEMEDDTQLTDFISDNYEMLVKEAVKFVDWDMAGNLVHDMYIALKNRENNGNGYTLMTGKKGDIITVRQSIFGYMKRASMNKKYQKVSETPEKSGSFKEIPCSVSCGEDYDTLTMCQRDYASAASYDDIEMTEEQYDLAENMSYLVTYEFGKSFKYSVMSVLQNVMNLLNRDAVTDDIIEAFKAMNPFEGASNEFIEAFKSVLHAGLYDSNSYKIALEKVTQEYEDMGRAWR